MSGRGSYPSAKQDQFVLRLPNGLRDRIKADAAASGRSMNAEIVARLEKPTEQYGFEAVLEGLCAISKRLDRIEANGAGAGYPHHYAGQIASRGGVLPRERTSTGSPA